MKGFLTQEILHALEDFNLRSFIHKKRFTLMEVKDDGILKDIDTMEDYYKLLKLEVKW
jgi:CTP:molybdopterin cytidylyltransferase MocA